MSSNNSTIKTDTTSNIDYSKYSIKNKTDIDYSAFTMKNNTGSLELTNPFITQNKLSSLDDDEKNNNRVRSWTKTSIRSV